MIEKLRARDYFPIALELYEPQVNPLYRADWVGFFLSHVCAGENPVI